VVGAVRLLSDATAGEPFLDEAEVLVRETDDPFCSSRCKRVAICSRVECSGSNCLLPVERLP
jgi:hypothetical protein